MDTRKWGSSGWKLLHAITFNYPNKPNNNDKINNLLFFNTIKSILPCRYCRESFEIFTKELCLIDNIDNKHKLSKWLYKVHNRVNDKLRNQGLLTTENPKYNEIKNMYENNEYNDFIPWEFLYCIIFNFPTQKKINIEVIQSYYTFFDLLNILIPSKHIRNLYNIAYKKYNIKCCLGSRIKLKQWLFKMNCFINNDLCKKNKAYKDICVQYDSYRSGCGKKTFKGVTCRALRKKKYSRKNQKSIKN